MLFKEVIGHSEIKKKLIDMVQQNRISHAQLFLGAEGGGNFPLALAYAQYVNCENPSLTDSCGTCHNCIKFQHIQHPDLTFIFPNAITADIKEKPDSVTLFPFWKKFISEKSYFTLQQWCEFIDIENKQPIINKLDSLIINQALNLKTFEGKYKVIIIWYPEKMNAECANKILKTLEEPTPNSLILMVAHQAEELLPTILSRVQLISVDLLNEKTISDALIHQQGLDHQNALSIANLSEGIYSNALEMAEHPEKNDYFIQQFQNWMRICYKLEILQLNNWIDEIAKIGREKQKSFLLYGMRMLRLCIVKNYGNDTLVKPHHLEVNFCQNFSPFIHGGNIVEFMKEFNDAHYAISRNGNIKMILMSMSLKTCNLLRYKP